jgi:hypothetical protein
MPAARENAQIAAPPIVSFGTASFDDGLGPFELEFSPDLKSDAGRFETGASAALAVTAMVHSPAKFDRPE